MLETCRRKAAPPGAKACCGSPASRTSSRSFPASAPSSTATTRGISPTIVDETIGCSARPLLFGSNFPIEKLWTSYAELVDAYRKALASFPEATQRAALSETAVSVYRL